MTLLANGEMLAVVWRSRAMVAHCALVPTGPASALRNVRRLSSIIGAGGGPVGTTLLAIEEEYIFGDRSLSAHLNFVACPNPDYMQPLQ
ncbi:uncharacterized protein B0H18DRAFT_1033950 [Fomitopsis serialis]|uniref:uncharacterized protein n=1 Tax=Fomitopsis serialis TaxID=139415 RepID=UPI0020073BD7|nr:uncharacterized protein B0H18DRAFT_1033950 [Neoantrodia serialis]KAH9917613.1 hypothetical protein B0H18DRAFT_1033950 [Neoantrodia serialis]